MNLKQIVTLAAVVLLTALLTRQFFPKTRTNTIRLPATTETVTVTSERIDTIWRERVRWRETVTTDTLVLADTIFQTAVETVAVLDPSWYIRSASIAQSAGDTSYYRLTWLAADSGSLRRRDALERHITLGPIRQLSADESGLSVDYGEFPEPGCGFGCKVQIGLGGIAVGILVWEIVR